MNLRLPMLPLTVSLLFVVAVAATAQQTATVLPARYEPSFGLLRDTVLVLDSTFLEVRLNEQMIYQHFRSGRVARYSCSTGDPRIKDGIATREGIYAIQWKARKHMSQQFQVYLNYWMPFDGGIGFHGLQGRSYYRYLGRRVSSHGCVRIANETGAKIFPSAPRGTVVWVHSGSPARIVRFGDTTRGDLIIMDGVNQQLLEARMTAVLEHRAADTSLAKPVAIRPGRPFGGRIAVGRVDRLHAANRTLPLITLPQPAIAPRTGRLRAPREARYSERSMLEAMLAEE
ncbi:MAG TPA: L,D-transpeptidase [Candidatus Kapabacteria bacterium]|nr:L,D-transpeptidase [Candidatus Kapabacteria bacterium]